jgi:hypothetical protein
MARQPSDQQRLRDRHDSKTRIDAGCALRRLADQRRYRGFSPYLSYNVCGILERAALSVNLG